jgi:hypothetical protein
MTAQLAVDIRNRGPASRFIRPTPGHYALSPSYVPPQTQAQPEAETAEAAVRRRDPQRVAQRRMSFLDAAEDVLRRSPEHAPMHYRAITRQALEEGLVSSAGATPEATMRAQIGVENRRRESRGQRPRFLARAGSRANSTRRVAGARRTARD